MIRYKVTLRRLIELDVLAENEEGAKARAEVIITQLKGPCTVQLPAGATELHAIEKLPDPAQPADSDIWVPEL